MKREARLVSARKWLTEYSGRRIVRSYARWFRVDLICAATELQLLGVRFDPEYLERLRTTVRERSKRRKKPTPEDSPEDSIESDGNFWYIAGYTRGGVPYGVPLDGDFDSPGRVEDWRY